MTRHLCVIGDALLDRDVDGLVERVAPDAPVPVVDERSVKSRPGGAALAAALAALDGREVTLVTALAEDEAGRTVASLLARAGVDVVDLGSDARTPEKVRVCVSGRALLRLDRGGKRRGRIGSFSRAAEEAIARASALLVADYGRGLTAERAVREAVGRAAARAPVVWDPHPRGAPPVFGARLVTPNLAESARFSPDDADGSLPSLIARAEHLLDRWEVVGVCITLGARGALLVGEGLHPLVVPAPKVHDGDPCGAGDRFAATAAGALGDGATPGEAVTSAVEAASCFVAAGGAVKAEIAARFSSTTGPSLFEDMERRWSARPRRALPERDVDAAELSRQVRALGGTVVATGGCFDLLHPGHVSMLQAARALGDCLVVCLNSDASVRRLKGPSRPVHTASARRELLLALGCVDAVEIFDEDDPRDALARIHPHVWVKAADYAHSELPEALDLSHWGGRAVVVPYRKDHSTTRLLEEVMRRAEESA